MWFVNIFSMALQILTKHSTPPFFFCAVVAMSGDKKTASTVFCAEQTVSDCAEQSCLCGMLVAYMVHKLLFATLRT